MKELKIKIKTCKCGRPNSEGYGGLCYWCCEEQRQKELDSESMALTLAYGKKLVGEQVMETREIVKNIDNILYDEDIILVVEDEFLSTNDICERNSIICGIGHRIDELKEYRADAMDALIEELITG